MPKDESKLSLSRDTWVKIWLVLGIQGVVLLSVVWALTNQYEHRLTLLETNQDIILKIVMSKHIGEK